jgi:hypothetical protein
MAEVAPDNSASKPTVDDLFQILITRDIPALVAKKQITEYLQLGKLRIDFHISADARSMRRATPEELRAAEHGGKGLDFLHEFSSAGGTTAAVDPQSWDNVFGLSLRGGRLVVEPLCSLDYPWQAYSFSISNPVAIDHLWPPEKSTRISTTGPDAGVNRPSVQGADAKQEKLSLKKWMEGEVKRTPPPLRKDRVHGWKIEYANQLVSKARNEERLKEVPESRTIMNYLVELDI